MRSIQKAIVTGGFVAGGVLLASNPVGLTVLGVVAVGYAVADLSGVVDRAFDFGERSFELSFEQQAARRRNSFPLNHPEGMGP